MSFAPDAGTDPENPEVPETPAHADLDTEAAVDELDLDEEAVVDELDGDPAGDEDDVIDLGDDLVEDGDEV
jgi:hypothetical protein